MSIQKSKKKNKQKIKVYKASFSVTWTEDDFCNEKDLFFANGKINKMQLKAIMVDKLIALRNEANEDKSLPITIEFREFLLTEDEYKIL